LNFQNFQTIPSLPDFSLENFVKDSSFSLILESYGDFSAERENSYFSNNSRGKFFENSVTKKFFKKIFRKF